MNKELVCGIYKITSPTGRIYVGKSKDINKRWVCYRRIDKNTKGQIRLYNSFLKHGSENHQFEIVEECEFSQLNIRERFWQDEFDVLGENGLNCLLTSTKDLSTQVSAKTLIKMKESKLGDKNPMFGKKHTIDYKNNSKVRMLANNPMKGKVGEAHHSFGTNISEEHKNLISKVNSIKVIDTLTGVIYDSIKLAAYKLNINKNTLQAMLANKSPNKTNLKYFL